MPKQALATVVKIAVAILLIVYVCNIIQFNDYFYRADGSFLVVRLSASPRGEFYSGVVVKGPARESALPWPVPVAPGAEFRVAREELEKTCEVKPGMVSLFRYGNKNLLLLFVAVHGICYTFSFVRFYFLLRVQQILVPFWEVMKICCVGLFFNNFLFSLVGGDLVKGLYFARHTPHKAKIVAVLLLDRVMGVVSLATMAGIASLFHWSDPDFHGVLLMVLCFDAVAAGMMLMFFNHFARQIIFNNPLVRRLPFHAALQNFAAAGQHFHGKFLFILGMIGLSALGNIAYFIANWGYALAMGADKVPFSEYFMIVPVALFISSLPISVGGWGVGEAIYIYLFQKLGESATVAAAVSISTRIFNIALGLPGMFLWFTIKKNLPMPRDVETAKT